MFRFESSVSGVRLDKYLTQLLPEYSRAYLQRLIKEGHILVNGAGTKASRKLSEGDIITVELPPRVTPLMPERIPLSVVYEDDDVLVIDKPAGLTVHPAPGHPDHTLVNAILAHCPDLVITGDQTRPGIVHRLDKDTSGLMVVAKNEASRQHLLSQFKSRAVTKRYLVLVKGKLCPEDGVIKAPIGRDPRNRKKMAIIEAGKEATTKYHVRRYLGNYSLLEITPITGRTHQIRVHLSAIGYPVVGDSVYGVKSLHLKRQFVHASCLGFRLPSTEEYREFTSPLPEDLEQALKCLAQST